MRKERTEDKNFETEIFKAMLIPDFACGFFFVLLATFFVDFQTLARLWWVFLIAIVALYLVVQFLVYPLINISNTRTVSRHIFYWKKRDYSARERTKLLYEISKIPKKMLFTVSFICFFYTVSWLLVVFFVTQSSKFSDIHISLINYVYMFVNAVFVGYVIGLYAWLRSEKVCNKYLCELVSEGVNEAEFNPKKLAGISMKYRNFLFLVLPIVAYGIESIIIFEHVFVTYSFDSKIAHVIIIVLMAINAATIVFCAIFNQVRGKNFSTNLISNLMRSISSSTFSYIPTDLNDELSYVVFLLNKSNNIMQQALLKATDTSKELSISVKSLVEISTENAASSFQQAASVKQIVSAMEYADSLSTDASNKISTVTDNIKENFRNVELGFESVNENVNKMTDISSSNIDFVDRIKSFSEQINGIWDIVNMINSVAEQTKIIAFNAELEASNAGDYGKNFHAIASDIRRIAEGTKNSVSEIRRRISLIQYSLDNLVNISQEVNEKVKDELRFTKELNVNFEGIKKSSESVQQSAFEMSEIILKQTTAFKQTLDTLKQIADSISISSKTSNTVNDYALKLKAMADDLYDLKKTAIRLTGNIQKGGSENV